MDLGFHIVQYKAIFVLSLFYIKVELQISLYHSFISTRMDVKRTMYMYMKRVNILL